ncbi:hypothetical protein B4U80_02420 [Leptotrombidium deliense]|uniref:Neuropeptide F n=1 Tax=Leptotrombidium deliense TaxID=299467 RepID=A0A443SEB4_9ACAR|nr:hypothetical protein B4U80_02420 [Leptotrombidium deliense]
MFSQHSKVCLLALFVSVAFLILIVPQTTARPSVDDMTDMAEALRYLEKLDRYYSQLARPRKYITLMTSEL